MKTQHTPGPWFQDTYSSGESIVYHPDREEIARVFPQVWPEVANRRDNANARLIVAAPELLDALQGMIRLHYDTAEASARGLEAVHQALAAIAKATGGGS